MLNMIIIMGCLTRNAGPNSRYVFLHQHKE